MKAKLEDFLSENFSATEGEIKEVRDRFKPLRVKKNELLQDTGNICQSVYFVESGCLRTFFDDGDGKEATRYVALEGQFIGPIHSFMDQSPSQEFIGAVESSELLSISHLDFRDGLKTIPLFKDMYTLFLERAYAMNYWRIEILLKHTAK
ncbi:hypothetical protein FUAX_53750 (plasmid) [Fulvitalea axinellae]|uniref:Cyclic nucleotide-binding domain-containing protein n=1 Tax=Fulvitalea axinellae TaxID=1182444 RepID=A0AAU9CS52_9BACT|nr:hypothetical protein FUAX_53750 [Fulvitalea axinellae]